MRRYILTTKELLDQAMSLPVEERTHLVDSILKSLNRPDKEIDIQWIETAKKRLEELRSGKVKAVSGDEVFKKVKERFGK
jgi:putative addiction module component (TIGR02574 family)